MKPADTMSRLYRTILSIVFTVQVSMNFNTSLYSNAVGGIAEEFSVSTQAARLGAAIFLITYAFGCELWAVRSTPTYPNSFSRQLLIVAALE